MNNETIKRSDAIEAIKALHNIIGDAGTKAAVMALEGIHAVDALEVVHAKWVNAPLCGNDNCRCSNCGSWHNIHANMRGEINYKYCPDCGSRMDGNDNV